MKFWPENITYTGKKLKKTCYPLYRDIYDQQQKSRKHARKCKLTLIPDEATSLKDSHWEAQTRYREANCEKLRQAAVQYRLHKKCCTEQAADEAEYQRIMGMDME
ncbi:hypothetical protein CVT25_011546 [Psilocybe cyanescens]|uniref:Uncharacterized protein n=1 Tax=Psilocybe cyanescens TaxID=93625 RepID=A0A409XCH0_PSICY|nr:hypothetical protein CVT25_011546 [Psilocybe cyanescens]